MHFHKNTALLQYAHKLLNNKHKLQQAFTRTILYNTTQIQCRCQHNAATQSQQKSTPFNPLDIQQLIRNATQHNNNVQPSNNTVKPINGHNKDTSLQKQKQDTSVSPRPNIPTRTETQSPVLQEANTQHYTPPVTNETAKVQTTTKPPAIKPRIRPNLAAIQLTEAAANRIKFLLSTQQNAVGIRIGVRSRGCSGLSYTINYVYADQLNTVKLDDKIQQFDVTVYIETKSLFYIVGTTMDYIDTELASEFVFNNPKAKSQCGCGESFTV